MSISIPKTLLGFLFSACILVSCAEIHQGPMDARLALAVVKNNLQEVNRNVNPRNATMRIRDEQPIYWAAAYGNEDMIDVLYNNGASLNYRSSAGNSLAFIAAAGGHPSTADKLVQLGAGSPSDVSRGNAARARTLERRKQETAAAMAFVAMLFQGMAAGGGSSGNSSGWGYSDSELSQAKYEYQQQQSQRPGL